MSNHAPHQAVTAIKQRAQGFTPKVGIILGSGLGPIAEKITDKIEIPYGELSGFVASTVAGHSGSLVLGYIEGVAVACLKGRPHRYEGTESVTYKNIIRTLKLLGCEILLMTNASGSLRPEVGPGELMLIHDHINFQGSNPLVGPNDEEFGERFFPMDNAYDAELRTLLKSAAQELDINLPEGVYISVLGPNFETPAEIRAFRIWGADAVGMSTVPEVLTARHCGLKVALVAAITNHAAGIAKHSLSHEETLHFGQQISGKMVDLMTRFLTKLS